MEKDRHSHNKCEYGTLVTRHLAKKEPETRSGPMGATDQTAVGEEA